MIQNVLVLGAGSAGLLAAITLKKKLPTLNVRIVRSSDIGVIGVGEGTTPAFPQHLFDYLGLDVARFFKEAEPTWKLGIRFLWGSREYFDYTFHQQFEGRWSHLSREPGFYAYEDFRGADVPSALMEAGKAFMFKTDGSGDPDMNMKFALHIENLKLVATLEKIAEEFGVKFLEGKVSAVERGPAGLTALRLEDGQRLEADFFVDCSGFRSELLGRAMEEPFVSYDRALFCDRAVIGGWDRTTETTLAYTTAETMEAGWAWQIEHEHHINRGYVYCSQAISDEAACEEFLRKNPKAPKSPRVVKFRSGRYRRMWVENVVAIGNAAGFVEPLEASALMAVTTQCQKLVDMFESSSLQPTESLRALYNHLAGGSFDTIRDRALGRILPGKRPCDSRHLHPAAVCGPLRPRRLLGDADRKLCSFQSALSTERSRDEHMEPNSRIFDRPRAAGNVRGRKPPLNPLSEVAVEIMSEFMLTGHTAFISELTPRLRNQRRSAIAVHTNVKI